MGHLDPVGSHTLKDVLHGEDDEGRDRRVRQRPAAASRAPGVKLRHCVDGLV